MERPERFAFGLFDFDGVIADTEPMYLEADRRALAQLGYEPTDAELHTFIGHPSERMAPALLAEHGIHATAEDYLAARNVTRDIYGNPALGPMEGLDELWEALVAHDVRVGVVSSSRVSDLVLALNRFDLLRYVNVVVGRDYVEHLKPAPDPYLRALAFLSPSEPVEQAAMRAFAVEDSPGGIASANAAGLYVMALAASNVAQDTSAASETLPSHHAIKRALLG